MELHDKEVRYDLWCHKCKFYDSMKTEENSDGTIALDISNECNDCLNTPSNTDSHKPVHFKEK